MVDWRRLAPVLNPVTSLTADEHARVKQLALEGHIRWSTSAGDDGALVDRFRAEVKDHYFKHQRRRCCYCSTELFPHKLTYDAEHILDKDEYPEYMFDEGNLAVACKLCNQRKSNKSISFNGARFCELSRNPDHYSIVHPHLDEWSHHLNFDSVGRIISRNSAKGRETIRICGMAALNAVRLADVFDIDDADTAEEALRTFHEEADPVRRQQLLELLGEMAERSDDPGAAAVMEALTMDLEPAEPGTSLAVLAARGPGLATEGDDPYLALQRGWAARARLQTVAVLPPIALLAPPAAAGPIEDGVADQGPDHGGEGAG